jgi:hypothetical protein
MVFSVWSVLRDKGGRLSQFLPEIERVQSQKSSFESVFVKKWVEFWRWQYKVTEKK